MINFSAKADQVKDRRNIALFRHFSRHPDFVLDFYNFLSTRSLIGNGNNKARCLNHNSINFFAF